MNRLSDFKNEEALDILADILEPSVKILQDEAFKIAVQTKDYISATKLAIKNNKSAVIEILARLNGKQVDEFECSFFSLPLMLLEILNDPELVAFFTSQGQNVVQTSFGSATENTQETEEK